MKIDGGCHCGLITYTAESGAQRAQITPKSQIWCRSALPWINDIASIPAHAMQPAIPK